MYPKSTWFRISTIFMIVVLIWMAVPIHSASAAVAGFSTPGIYSNSTLLNPGNAYVSDDIYVQSTGNSKSAIYGNFGFSIPAGSTINLVEVSVESRGTKNWKVSVSKDGGASYSAFTTITNTLTDTVTVTEGPGMLWGLVNWTPNSLNNANFKVKITSAGGSASNVAYLDQLKVRITYTPISTTPTTLVITTVSGIYGGTVDLKAKLTLTSNNSPLNGKTISFDLDGFARGTAVTDTNGEAILSGVTLTTGLSNTTLNVGTYNVDATFVGDATYAFVSSSASQVVNPLGITVSANAQSKTYGAGDPTLTYSFTPALIGMDAFRDELARAAGEIVDIYAINQGTLALNSNYTITYHGANLTITPLAITVTADDKAVLVGNPDPSFTFGVSNFIGSDIFITSPICTVSDPHTSAGSYSIVCSGGDAGDNYTITYNDGTLTVTEKPVLTVTPADQTITYGDSDPYFTFVYSGFVDDDTDITGIAPSCSVNGPHTNAGSYPSITCSGGVDVKYAFSYTSGTLIVNPLTIAVTANAQSKTYGSSDPTLTYLSTPSLIGEDAFSGVLVRSSGENVGVYAITKGTLTLGPNYTITYVGANLTIDKAPLTVTADDQTIGFKAPDPLFTFEYDGFVNGENSSVINTPPTCGVLIPHTVIGTYPIVCSGGSDDNYSFLYVNGTFTVLDPGPDTTGVFRPSNGALYLKNTNTTGYADVAINYGMGGDYPVVGDWDGNGTATIGIYRNGVFYLRNANTIGYADIVFAFGAPGDQPVAGDWDGDGIDTVGVYRSSAITFYLRNSNSAGAPQMSFSLGNPGDVGIAGDWNGDGVDTTGVFRPSNGALYLKNTNATGYADLAINYGVAGDQPVTGDWNNDGMDTIGIYRNGTFYLRNANTIGYADLVFALGVPGDMPIAGNWDGLP